MKILIFIVKVCASFFQNIPIEKKARADTLIKSSYKVIKHGYLHFLAPSNNYYEHTVYSYSINREQKKVYVSLLQKEMVNLKDIDIMDYKTDIEWAKDQRYSFREEYFSIFHYKFLFMTNKEKLELLERLAITK